MSDKRAQNHLVRVFNGNLWQAEIVQGVLQTNHIKCMLENDTLSAVTSPYATLGGEVWVLVNENDKEAAALLIKNNRLECNPFN